MYYTIIDDLGHTCGHKHKTYHTSLDCLDKLIDKKPDLWDIPAVEIIEVKKKVDFQWIAAFWNKYGQDLGHTVQQTMDKLYPA
jgi:hypothetical protein